VTENFRDVDKSIKKEFTAYMGVPFVNPSAFDVKGREAERSTVL
jgi:hypothetical protein